MKHISENHNNNGSNSGSSNSSSNNWLGFSLSPLMKMEASNNSSSAHEQVGHHHDYLDHYTRHHQHSQSQQQQQQSPVPVGMFLSPPPLLPQQPLSSGPICFDHGGGGDSSSDYFHTPLTVMPLKSDGSLCIMEAFTRSQPPQVRKLENFLGMSLDSIYRQQQHTHQQQQQLESYISALSYQGFSEDDLLKNWETTVDNIGSTTNTLASVAAPTVGGCGDLQSLSLSMSPGSQSSCITAPATTTAASTTANVSSGSVCVGVVAMDTKKRGFGKVGQSKQTVHRKSIDTFGQRTSQYRGVTKHRWTGRFEAHLWDNSCKKEGQTRKGRQVYLGGYDMEEKAARSYDLAALKYWGLSTHTNFPIENYKQEIEEMKNMTRQEYVANLRRKSSGFSRGASMYRGVTRHHQHGRWQARIGRVAGNKDLYLGTFSTQEEAAEAYDVAAIKFRGTNAVTNFDISRYHVEKIMSSNTLLAGEQARRNKLELIKAFEESPSSTENITDLVELEMASPSQKLGSAAHFSSASSLVTSLNSSREGSPDENMSSTTSNSMVFPWVASAGQLTPSAAVAATAIPLAHVPVFAAWNDA
ncbi:AP2-like ethylene-responsive transcription factor ANT isoform X2 [Chenopodium quinoa]|uniref:AP2-like ethylene-responsive transcription factor ANT isoform X2 n=1 Tax=Chenopodium quinoa TaxID=63459 RepID=UPI000B77A3F0|nr:AP2-like ethylene-responsive transcription factor ANT isoform X2 [Chenopodium quinoa]